MTGCIYVGIASMDRPADRIIDKMVEIHALMLLRLDSSFRDDIQITDRRYVGAIDDPTAKNNGQGQDYVYQVTYEIDDKYVAPFIRE